MFNPSLNYLDTKAKVEFKGDSLKQEKISFDDGKVVSIYIVYEINKNVNMNSYLSLENYLFGTVKLTKILILISTNILDMVLDLIEKDFFHLLIKLVET